MIEVNVPALESLQLEGIQELLRSPGPCITILLPAYRPGAQAKSMAAILKTDLQDATRKLAARRIPDSALTDLLAPLQQLTEAKEFVGGSHCGRAIFRSPEVFTQFEMIEPMEPAKAALTVGAFFNIRSVLSDLQLPPEFYVLKLSQKQVGLLRCTGFRSEAVELPKGVPHTFDEAMAFKAPDHDLENRSAAGSSIGSMRGVRFGTGSGRETQQTHLADFYKAVDRGVRELLRAGAPLVLAGVQEETAAYQSVSSYSNLLDESVPGSANTPISEDELLRRAYSIVRSNCVDREAASLIEARERLAPARFSLDLDAVLRAAAGGRVDRLYVNEGAQVYGVFEGERRGSRPDWGEEDLVNVAAVETILQGGRAFALPDAQMPNGAAGAAALRY